ncbi:MAG: cytochrome C oxidase subunit IV family protein [Bdellovibrionota bacterium]
MVTPHVSEEKHHHPNYVAIWAVLLALLLAGIVVGNVQSPVLGAALVFGVAGVKAYIVAANYMHLKYEPLFVKLIVGSALACIVLVLIGLIPDVVYVYGD